MSGVNTRMDTVEDKLERAMSEVEKVIAWRFFRLLECGAGMEAAEKIALNREVDLHTATEMLEAGCSGDLLVCILL